MTIEHKSFKVDAKSADEPGTFWGYASAFDSIDSYGDVMVKGAFADSIKTRGFPAISYEHNWEAPPIGVVVDAIEDDYGLKVKGRLFTDHPDVASIYAAMKAGGLTEMSFAFLTKESEDGEFEGKSVRFVKAVDWLEAAVVWKGANDRAQLVSVRKSAEQELAEQADEIVAQAQFGPEALQLLRAIDLDLATHYND